MRKIIKIVLLVLIVAFITMQFFQPKSNIDNDFSGLITEQEQIPDNIKTIFKNACLDCHSNNSRYWWYDKISPVSWIIDNHIIEGKDELNLSEWAEMDVYDQIGALDDIGKEVGRKKMPLKSYTFMHKQARLDDEQIKALVEWTEKYSEELLKSLEE
jgi:hypothetical protein